MLVVAGLALWGSLQEEDVSRTLEARVSWIGNTFPGGDDRWVQNSALEVDVTPEGAVWCSSEWDEAGRCVGEYQDGRPATKLFRQFDGRGGHKAWGWGTAGRALAVDEHRLYLVNTAGELLRFDRTHRRYLDAVAVGKALDMTVHAGELVLVLEGGRIERRRADAPSVVVGGFRVAGAQDVAVDRAGRFWIRVDREILGYDREGRPTGRRIQGLEDPSDVAVSHDAGNLLVCDNGSRNQILEYDLSPPEPRRIRTYGVPGGLRTGTPGRIAGEPWKLFSIRGANKDRRGNLYVVLGRNAVVVRKYRAGRELEWEAASHFFIEAASVLPSSDGTEIYGREEIFSFDPESPEGTVPWRLKSLTADYDRNLDDARKDPAGIGWVRERDGRRLLFVTGQMAGPMSVFYFDPERHGDLAQDAGFKKGEGWAVWPDARGDVWYFKEGRVVREELVGFEPSGKPIYGAARTYRVPDFFRSVERLVYWPSSDTLFVGGFTRERPDPGGAWGLVGTEVVRIDHFTRDPRVRYRRAVPFKTWHGGGSHEMIMPKSLDAAGEYFFVAYVCNAPGDGAKPPVRVYRAEDGGYVGDLRPVGPVGGISGWVDIAFGMSAFLRKNGEYWVLVEEGYRGKNVLYRWKP
jgi:hypothetical protein